MLSDVRRDTDVFVLLRATPAEDVHNVRHQWKKIKVLSEFIGKKALKGIWSKVEVLTSGFLSDRSCEDEFHCCPNNTECGQQLYSASNP